MTRSWWYGLSVPAPSGNRAPLLWFLDTHRPSPNSHRPSPIAHHPSRKDSHQTVVLHSYFYNKFLPCFFPQISCRLSCSHSLLNLLIPATTEFQIVLPLLHCHIRIAAILWPKLSPLFLFLHIQIIKTIRLLFRYFNISGTK